MSILTRTEIADNTLVRMSAGSHQLHCITPAKKYNPKVGLSVRLPEGESINVDFSGIDIDPADNTVGGPDLEFGLDLFSLQELHALIGEFLAKEPWKTK